MSAVGDSGGDIIYPHEISSLSDTQEKVLVLLPILPALLSVLGSGSIIRLIIKDGKHSPYRRMLFCMSCCDIVSSISLACQAWLVPRETSQWVWAVGNDATCTAIGTMTQFSLSNCWYAGMLSFYFLLVVRYGWREERFARRVEPVMHILSIGFPLGTAIAGAIIGIYNELEVGPGCWITNYPENCGGRPGATGETCASTFYGYAFAFIPIVLIVLSLIANHLSIYQHVRRTTMRTSVCNLRGTDASRQQTRAVAKQAFLYVGAYTICFFWPLLLRALESNSFGPSDQDKVFPLLILQSIFLPAQGFFNLGVFLRPRVNTILHQFKQEGWFWAVRRALYGDSIQQTKRSSTQTDEKTSRSKCGGSNPNRDNLMVVENGAQRQISSENVPDTIESFSEDVGNNAEEQDLSPQISETDVEDVTELVKGHGKVLSDKVSNGAQAPKSSRELPIPASIEEDVAAECQSRVFSEDVSMALSLG